ncbi:thiolase C-terminal domain-containing protein [Microbaculum marinum]
MAGQAIRNAVSDAGLRLSDIDGMLSHSMADSTVSQFVAADLGIRLNFHLDSIGGGASVEALVGVAIGVIEAGMCETVAVYRSMNGYSGVRIGAPGKTRIMSGAELHTRGQGLSSPAQSFAPAFMRHMHVYGTTPQQVAMVKVIHSEHAARNPKALYPKQVTVDQVLESRIIAEPIHLLECCVETDSATCIIVTSRERAMDCRHVPVFVQSVVGRVSKPRSDIYFLSGDITTTAGRLAADRLWRNAGIGPEHVDVTAAYDAFTFTSLLLLEDYGFCSKGEGGAYVSDGTMRLGGQRPNNTGGGLLCEGYSNGMNLVIENVRQLRHDADDGCPVGASGRRMHTYDHGPAGMCRQVRDARVAANLGWGTIATGSAMVLARD